jgi:hypothetical protein
MSVAQNQPPSTWGGIKTEAEPLAKVLAAAAVVAYVAGVVTINAYLDEFGVSEFAALRPRAIYTGTWALLTFALLHGTIFGIADLLFGLLGRGRSSFRDSPFEYPKIAFALKIIGAVLFAIAVTLSAADWILGAQEVTRTQTWLVICFLPAAVAWRLATDGVVNRKPLSLPVFAAAMLAAFLAYANAFALSIYADLPENYGGGKIHHVQLLMKAGTETAAASLQLPMAGPSSRLTAPVMLIYRSDATLVVAAPHRAQSDILDNELAIKRSHRILQFDRSNVEGMLLVGDSGRVTLRILGSELGKVTRGAATLQVRLVLPDRCTIVESDLRDGHPDAKFGELHIGVVGRRPAHAICSSAPVDTTVSFLVRHQDLGKVDLKVVPL